MSAWISAVVVGAEQWYSSGTFWAAMGVGVALLIGVSTFLVTWVPRQRLHWAPPSTPLLASGTRDIADLEIRHDGRQLADPYLLEVTLTARGRRDIPSSAFDQGRPLVFDLGAGIVKVLRVRCSPASSLVPPVTNEGSALRVGPELVGLRQITTISVLVDGDPPHLVCHSLSWRKSLSSPETPRRVVLDDNGDVGGVGGGGGGAGGGGAGGGGGAAGGGAMVATPRLFRLTPGDSSQDIENQNASGGHTGSLGWLSAPRRRGIPRRVLGAQRVQHWGCNGFVRVRTSGVGRVHTAV